MQQLPICGPEMAEAFKPDQFEAVMGTVTSEGCTVIPGSQNLPLSQIMNTVNDGCYSVVSKGWSADYSPASVKWVPLPHAPSPFSDSSWIHDFSLGQGRLLRQLRSRAVSCVRSSNVKFRNPDPRDSNAVLFGLNPTDSEGSLPLIEFQDLAAVPQPSTVSLTARFRLNVDHKQCCTGSCANDPNIAQTIPYEVHLTLFGRSSNGIWTELASRQTTLESPTQYSYYLIRSKPPWGEMVSKASPYTMWKIDAAVSPFTELRAELTSRALRQNSTYDCTLYFGFPWEMNG